MDEQETIVCSTCLAEPSTNDDGTNCLDGWNTESEFGDAICPECAVDNSPIGQSEGLEQVAEKLRVKKKKQRKKHLD